MFSGRRTWARFQANSALRSLVRTTVVWAGLALICAGLAPQTASAVSQRRLHTDSYAINRLPEPPTPPPGPGKALTGAARALASASDVRLALPGLWCGTQRASDDLEHQTPNGAYTFHAIYALPQGAINRFGLAASTLQADAFQASALLERLYGRAIRFDLGTSCGAQYLDISVVRLPESASALAAIAPNSAALIERIAGALRAQGFAANPLSVSTEQLEGAFKNYVVWLEDVQPAGGLCGVGGQFGDARRGADNLNNYGGQLAVIFKSGGRFCNSNTVRHEIGHTLGALQANAPNAFDGAHCDDAREDTMCYPQAPSVSSDRYQTEFFDYNNDDYWDPVGRSLSRWTVNLSRFVCPDAACNVATSATSLLDALGGLISGLLVSCPEGGLFDGKTCPANTTTDSSGEVAMITPPAPRLKLTYRRVSKGRLRVAVRLTGVGKARVVVTCRRGRGRVRVFSRRLTAPRTVRVTVRCNGRPTGRVSPA